MKQTSGPLWTTFLANGAGPLETTDKNADALAMEQQPIANLEAPIEDCDFPIGETEDEITICKLKLFLLGQLDNQK